MKKPASKPSPTPPAASAGHPAPAAAAAGQDYSTLEVAHLLGLAVRSVQLMVDRGTLDAWKTPGGHRRISRESVERLLAERAAPAAAAVAAAVTPPAAAESVLLIEDSKHYQNLVSMLIRDRCPNVSLHVADDGIAGLAMAGRLQPRLLIVDVLLPGIDGPTLIMSLCSHPQFSAMRLIVITSLEEADLAPYRFALDGVPVVHKSRIVTELPSRLAEVLSLPETIDG